MAEKRELPKIYFIQEVNKKLCAFLPDELSMHVKQRDYHETQSVPFNKERLH